MESRINHPEDYLSTSSDDDNAEINYESMLIDDAEDYDMEFSEFNELGVGLGQVGVEMSELGVGLMELEGLEEDLEMDGLYDLADLDVDDVDW